MDILWPLVVDFLMTENEVILAAKHFGTLISVCSWQDLGFLVFSFSVLIFSVSQAKGT